MEYANSSAIEVFYAEDVEISHNELNNCPYTGISVGWGWTPDITTQRNFKVLDNRIIGDTQKLVWLYITSVTPDSPGFFSIPECSKILSALGSGRQKM